MLRRLRHATDPRSVSLAFAGALALFFLSGHDPFWSDWGDSDGRHVERLMVGDVQGFIDNATATYLGSLILRSPIYLFAALFGAGQDGAFLAGKVVALLVLCGFGAWLLTHARRAGAGMGALAVIALLTAANPIAGRSLDYGHVEDPIAATLMIAGVLAAARGRLTWAGVLVGLAVVMKQWAVLAILPAIAVAPERQWKVLAPLIPLVTIFNVPLLFRTGGLAAAGEGFQTGAFDIWRAHQWFWPLGVDNPDPAGYRPRVPPEWFVAVPRLVIVGLSLPLSLLWWRHRRRGGGRQDDVLLLLAVLFLGRVVFEPWNIDYYHLPFLFTLVTWEVRRTGGLPLLSLAATGGVWFSFNTWTSIQEYGNATWLMYTAWTLPLAFVLVRSLLFADARLPRPQALLRMRPSANPSVSRPPGPA